MVADTIYGNSPEFRKAVEGIPNVTYLVAMPFDTQCWHRRPLTVINQYQHGGEIKTKQVVETTETAPIRFDTFAKSLNDFFWYRRKVREGAKGPIEYEFTKRLVVISRNGIPEDQVWLIIRRTLDENPTHSYFISNAMGSTRLKIFVWLSGIRWAIEQCFEETKTELGMDHYEVRKWPGWVHHMMTCMLSHFFLWHMKVRLGKKNTGHYSIADSYFD